MTKGRFIDPDGDAWYFDMPRTPIHVGPNFMVGWEGDTVTFVFSRHRIAPGAKATDHEVAVEVSMSKEDFESILHKLNQAFPPDK